jgi:hypothetical protein
MKIHTPIASLSIAAISLFVIGCTQTRISSFVAEVSEAPEVHGFNTYQEPHTTAIRVSGMLNFDSKEDVNVDAKHQDWADSKTNENHYQVTTINTRGVYKIGGIDVEGKLDFLAKAGLATIGFGIGINDGIYHHLTLGINSRYLDIGAFAGLYHHHGNLKYNGSECSTITTCDPEDWDGFHGDKTEYKISFLGGFYAGLILGDAFFNYSLSTYTPNIDAHGEGLTVPAIYSHYFTLGYRINRYIEINGGTVGSYIEDIGHWHWAGRTGLSFYWI